jgi:hypothetical protein
MRSWTRPCKPSLDDLQRRADLDMRPAAVELAAGIVLGLYNCRHGNSETLLEYCPDYAAERASGVVSDCAGLGIELPAVGLLDLMPGGAPCCIEPAINPRQPWAGEREAPEPLL